VAGLRAVTRMMSHWRAVLINIVAPLLLALATVGTGIALGADKPPAQQPATVEVVSTHAHIGPGQDTFTKPRAKPHKAKPKIKHSYWIKKIHGKLVVDPVKLGRHLNNLRFGKRHWWALFRLWSKESGWRPYGNNNPSTGACGIPQANPCSKMGRHYRSVKGQILWGLNYIKRTWRNPTRAWQNSMAHDWY
jgi:hypothetical protein